MNELLSDNSIIYIFLWWFAEVTVVLVGAADDNVVSDCDFDRVVVVLLYCFTFSLVTFVVALIGVVGDDVDSDCNFGMNVTVLLCYFSFSFICQCWQIFYNVLIGFVFFCFLVLFGLLKVAYDVTIHTLRTCLGSLFLFMM